MNIDRTGTFKCRELDRGITFTKNQYPQLVIRVQMLAYYDNDEGEWVDYSEYDMQMNGYFTLFGIPKGKDEPEPTLNHTQIMKVYGWDGRDFQVLAEMDAPEVFQVRVEENDYEAAKSPYQINWIDKEDADPNRSLKKLEVDDLKKLTQKFGSKVKAAPKAAKASKPKSPKPKSPKPKPPKTEKPKAKKDNTALEGESAKSKKIREENEKLKKDVEERNKKAAAKKADGPPPPPEKAADDSGNSGLTKQEAWEFVVELSQDECTDEQRTEAWHSAITEVGGGAEEDDITGQQWHDIAQKVIDVIGKF